MPRGRTSPAARSWPQVKPIKAMERLRADADVVANVSHIVTLRYFVPFNSTDYRLLLLAGPGAANVNARVLDIQGIVDSGNRHRWWEATCNEVQT